MKNQPFKKKKNRSKSKEKDILICCIKATTANLLVFYNTSTTKGSGRGISIVSSPAVHWLLPGSLNKTPVFFGHKDHSCKLFLSSTLQSQAGSAGIVPSLLASTTKSSPSKKSNFLFNWRISPLYVSRKKKRQPRTTRAILPCSAFPANASTLPTTPPAQEWALSESAQSGHWLGMVQCFCSSFLIAHTLLIFNCFAENSKQIS